MARGKKKSKLKFSLLAVLSVIIVGIGVGTFVQLPGVDASNEKTVELPPLSFAGGYGDNNSAIFAKVKQTTYIIDSDSKIVNTDQSTAIEGNPLLAFIDPSSGKSIAGAIVIPKIWIDYTTAFHPEITLDASTLELVVQSQLPNGSWKVTAVKSIQTFANVPFNYGDAELALASFGIDGSDIYDDLPVGDYNTLQRFSVSGNLHMHYTDFPAIKMTIPIGANDLKSWYTAKVTNDNPVTDTDGDGINDSSDQCPTQPENFNGYQDTDGCADSPPSTEPPSNPTDPDPTPITDEQQCALDGRVWTNGVCVDSTSGSGTGSIETIPFAVVSVKTNYLDDSSSYRAFTSSDGSFDFILNSLIVDGNGRDKSVGSIVYETFIGSFGSSLQGYKVSTSDLKYKGTVDIASKQLNVGTKNGAGGTTSEAKALSIFDGDTSIKFNGMSVSQATFTSVDIHNAVSSFQGIELVPEGSQRSLDFIVDISGSVVLSGPSGNVPLVLSGASTTFEGMKLVNQVVAKGSGTVYDSFDKASLACGGSDKVKAIGGGEYSCIGGSTGTKECNDDQYVVVIENTPQCLTKGTTTPGETPRIGEPGVEICIDAKNPNGKPCTVEYREIWCNGTTSCEVPPSKQTPTCDDTASCTPVGGDGDGDSCTDTKGFQTQSIAENICINGDDSGPSGGDPGKVCSSTQSCIKDQFGIDLNDPLTLGVIVIGAIVLLVSVTKRDSRYSPIPASTTQFSR